MKHKHYWLPEPSTRRENVAKWSVIIGTVLASAGILVWILNN